MSDLKSQFEAASVEVKGLTRKPRNDDLLALYSLFKQATIGDVAGKRPGMLDLVGRAKYDAWAARKGETQDTSMKSYIELVARLKKA